MKKGITRFLFCLILSSSVSAVEAQDLHFSQFYNTDMLESPANTGLFDGDYRGGVIYRNQWTSIPVPYRTFMAFGDMRLKQGDKSKNLIGLGFMVFSDHAGDLKYNFTNFGISLAYHHALDYWFKKYLSAGLMLNIGNTTVDYSGALFESNILSGTTIPPGNYLGSLSMFDLSGGLRYTVISRRRKSHYFGLSAYHLTQPKYAFISNARLPVRLTLESGMQVPLNYRYDLIPKIYITQQGPHTEIDLGGLVHLDYRWYKKETFAVYAGAFYRVGDAFIPTIRVDNGNITMTVSYDVNTSKLDKATNYQGGTELSLIWKGRFKHYYRHSLDSPRF